MPPPQLSFDRDRIQALLDRLEAMAAGETQTGLPISPRHDELDAIAHGINVLAGELRWAHERMVEAERAKADQVREEALRLSDANFATAFHFNPCAMTITRVSDGRFLDVNASFERMTGFDRADVIGRTIQEFGLHVDPDDLASIRAEIGSGFSSREVRFSNKQGVSVTAVCSAEIVMFGGGPCVLGVGLDVTERRHAETQAAKLRDELAHLGRVSMLEALAGSLAHEIKQPLTAVMAHAETGLLLLAVRPPRLPELRDVLDDIVRDNKRAADVVRHLRTLLKKSEAHHEPLDVNCIVGEVVKLIQNNAIGRRVGLTVELAPGVERMLGDRMQIQQVVINFLMNAFDAVQPLDPAERHVRLRTFRRDGHMTIEVIDYGHGLTDEALTRVFEPFYTTKQEGLGLGLPICRTIVEAHGGAIEARRNTGPGMTFSASFPILERRSDDARTAAPRLQEQR
jgi:PAS domain S-box-containing protein